MDTKALIQCIKSSSAAGIAISIGCIAYLATGNAWLFPIGLFIVCFYNLRLYTGRICWATQKDWLTLIMTYLGNTCAAYVMGIIISYAKPGLVEQAQTMVTNKLNEGIAIIPLAMLCNVMIFVAVSCWKISSSPVVRVFGLVFATMVFVYCGFEHCIANAFYFGLGRNACSLLSTILFLLANAVWNGIGGIITRRALEESTTYDYKTE